MAPPGPFPGMTQIGPAIYYHTPSHLNNSSSAPQLVILCTWMAAQPTHITKYITGYQSLFPTAKILLIRSEAPDILYRSTKTLHRRIQPALDVVRSVGDDEASAPRILLHVFSNGGSHQATNLLQFYQDDTGHKFPLHAKILDSCPGRGNFSRSYLALAAPFERQPIYLRLPASFAIVLILCLFWLLVTSFGAQNPIETIRQRMNDKSLVSETKRVYTYSDTDPMVHWQEVEDHAEDARSKGFLVEMEKFKGSGHAAHVRIGGGERYWRIVEELWAYSKPSNEDI